MDAIILAGGKGSRMDEHLPKPLVLVKNKPILAYQLDYFLNSGLIAKIILALGHRADEIISFVKNNYQYASIDFSVENEPLGTAGAIKQALLKSSSDFVLVLNCDDLTDIDLNILKKCKENTICVANPQLPFGLVKENNGYAVFKEKPVLDDWVSCGWYVFDRNNLLEILPDKGSLEYEVFPKLKLRVLKHKGFWQPLNTKKDLGEFAEKDLPLILK